MSTWILLRGLTREVRHWGAFHEHFAQSAGDVLAVDLPGNGEYASVYSPTRVEELVECVRQAVSARGAREPYRVLAMSLGGMVATEWALAQPHEVSQLVLVNTSMRPYSNVIERLRPTAWPGLARAALRWRDAREVEQIVHRLTCRRDDTLDDDLAAWQTIRTQAPVSRANALRQLAAAARFAARGVPRAAALVVSSRGDQLVNPACSARLAAAWGARHVEHPWAGHDLPHDDPHWLCAAVHAWQTGSAMIGT